MSIQCIQFEEVLNSSGEVVTEVCSHYELIGLNYLYEAILVIVSVFIVLKVLQVMGIYLKR